MDPFHGPDSGVRGLGASSDRRASEGLRSRDVVEDAGLSRLRRGSTLERGARSAAAGLAAQHSALRADERQAEANEAREEGDERRAARLERETEREVEGAQSALRQADAAAPKVRSFQDVGDVGDAGELVAGTVGALPFSLGPTLAGAAIGRGLGGRIGGAAGGFATTYPQERARAALEQRNDPGVADKPVEERLEEGRETAIPATAMQLFAPDMAMNRMRGAGILNTPTRKTAATAATEAGAEAGADVLHQQSLEDLGSEADYNPDQTIDAALQGAIGGGVMGGAPSATGKVLGLARDGLSALPDPRDYLGGQQDPDGDGGGPAPRGPVNLTGQDAPRAQQRQQTRQQRFEQSTQADPDASPAERLRSVFTDPEDAAVDGIALDLRNPAVRERVRGATDEQAEQVLDELEGDQQLATEQMAAALGIDTSELDTSDPAQQADIARTFERNRQARSLDQNLSTLEEGQQREDGGIQLSAEIPDSDRSAFLQAAEPLLRESVKNNPRAREQVDRAVQQILQLSTRPMPESTVTDDAAPVVRVLDMLFEDPTSAVQQLQDNFSERLPEGTDLESSMMNQILSTPRATFDARDSESFLRTMMEPEVRRELSERQIRRLGQAVDDVALEGGRQDLAPTDPDRAPQSDLGPEGVMKALDQAFGNRRNTEQVISYYRARPEAGAPDNARSASAADTALRRQARARERSLSRAEREAGLQGDAQAAERTAQSSMGFDPDLTDAQRTAAGFDARANLSEGEAEDTSQLIFQDNTRQRPWFRGDSERSPAEDAPRVRRGGLA